MGSWRPWSFSSPRGAMTFHGRSAILAGLQSQLQEAWDRSPDDARLADALGLLSAVSHHWSATMIPPIR